MPEVSIIVPVYNVEAYLEECLDSILGQSFRDLELIAVDDCSPDDSASILRRYEEKDSRVRVVSLPRNVGLGQARNAGLEAATGRYVWFVDSDDSIMPGSLDKVVARAHATGAEVVVFGWVRSYEDGRVAPGAGEALLAAAPETFSASDWPNILWVLHIACNKLILRELLDRTGLRFAPGLYEDVSFTYPLLAAAARITALPEAFLNYRQRSSGAITRTVSDRHLDALSQWDLALTRTGEMEAVPARLRAELFRRMVWHGAHVVRLSGRLPARSRPRYARGLRALFHKHRPRGGYRTERFAERLHHWVVGIGSLYLLRLHQRATDRTPPIGTGR